MLHHNIAVRDECGQIVKCYGSSVDIEDGKRSEDKIRAQEAEVRQILDLAPQHLGVFGPEGTPLYVNHVALEYFESTSTNGAPSLELISFIQKIVNTLSVKERSDFSLGLPMSSKLGC